MTVVMMERSDGGESEIWGTREDLLLAFAVLRHGAKDWDAIAKEVRSKARAPQEKVTSQDCKNRYHGLRRRFEGVVDGEIEGGQQDVGASAIPWMEKLRQLRVAELRREVERHDVSIVTLETKLKTLTEEREEGRKGERQTAGETDLDDKREKACEESPTTTPGNVAGDFSSGNRPGGGSCEESTSPRRDLTPVKGGGGLEPVDEPSKKPDLDAGAEDKGPGESSCNGSSDSITKLRSTGGEEGEAKASGAPPESVESMAESKEAAKESSDVQSSASLSKKLRGRRRKAAVSGGSSGGDEADAVSPSSGRQGENKSRPLAGFLEMIRSNKHGSVFERRLEIQESARYRSMIRQHMDLDIIRSKLEGPRPYTTTESFRDLLLLCNNAIVFFSKDSSEHIAATHLRGIVNREIAASNNKPPTSQSTSELLPMVPLPLPQPSAPPSRKKSESDADAENLAPEKRRATPVPLLACRKRTTVSAKVSATASEPVTAKEEKDGEKPVDLEKELEDADKKKREVPVARGLRTTKARAAIRKRIGIENSTAKPISYDDRTAELTKTTTEEKHNNNGAASLDSLASNAKKRSAVSFLDRLKNGTVSTSNRDSLLQTPKNSRGGAGGGGKGGSSEQKKGGKGEGKKEQTSARQVGGRQTHERVNPAKRSVGRPPKRPQAKRARETERDVSPSPPSARGYGRKKARR